MDEKERQIYLKFTGFVGYLTVISGILLLPFVAKYVFLFGSIRDYEKIVLLVCGVSLLTFGSWLLFQRGVVNEKIVTWIFSLNLIFFIEIFFRVYVVFFNPTLKEQLVLWSERTYTDKLAYIGHPYLQYVGKSGVELKGSKALEEIPYFNSYGFPGKEPSEEKRANEIRIVCLGESTTADGYPDFLEKFLYSNAPVSTGVWFNVYNFAQAGWNTTNSVVNLIVNVVDLKPDYLIIHHGWNEERIRGFEKDVFKTDYTHVMKPLETPLIYDRYLIRASGLYRYVKSKYDQAPNWMGLGTSIEKEVDRSNFNYNYPHDLDPFKRNIKIILHLCELYNIKLVIATIPCSTNPEAEGSYGKIGLDQSNGITRAFAKEHSEKILLADLDSAFTGKVNHVFTDFAHVTDEGREIKSSFIGSIILSDSDFWQSRLSPSGSFDNYESRIEFYINKIRTDNAWYHSVVEKAEDRNISLDEMIRLDAEFMVNQEDKRH